MKVRYSPRATADLVAIADYLGARTTQGAHAVERAIRATVTLIADFPGSGRVVGRRPSVRVIPVTRYPYLIFYTVSGDVVIVLHVRHSARKPADVEDL